MTSFSKALLRRVRKIGSAAFCTCLIGTLVLVGSISLVPTTAKADGGLETQKGGLFHRKGWINPEIHRKPESKKPAYDTSRRSRLGGPVGPVTKAQTPSRKSRQVARSAKKASAPKARSSNRRIPSQVVQKRERSVTKTARSTKAQKQTRVASLGKNLELPTQTQEKKTTSVTGSGRVQWVASSGCVPARLKAAINHVALNFGRVRVNSTCRSRSNNRRVGGATRSLHLSGQAADIRIFGNIGGAARYLRQVVGGFRHYGGGLFHIDTGPRRSW